MFPLSQTNRGILLLVIGVIMLLQAFEMIRLNCNLFLVLLGVGFIAWGLVLTGYHEPLMKMIRGSSKPKSDV